MLKWRQIYLRSPVLDARGKTGVPGENLRKQVWTGNQMHIWCRDWESNSGPLVHIAGEEPLRYLLPQLLKHGQVSCRWLRVMKQNRLPAHLQHFKQNFKVLTVHVSFKSSVFKGILQDLLTRNALNLKKKTLILT